MNSNLFKRPKNRVAATIALLFFVLLGAGTVMAMKAPAEKKSKNIAAKKHNKQSSLYWYSVDASTNKTTSASQYHDTKSNVVSAQDCKDSGTPICLFGSTNSAVAIGTNVGTPSASNRINQTAP